jgi:hypothetical protein
LYHKQNIDYNHGQIQALNDTHTVLATKEELDAWQKGDYSDILVQM